jgi:hypothetical protein
MKTHLLVAGAACLVLALTGPATAEINDLADLVPAHSLAYLELHDPPRLAREIHALVKGSYLQHPAAFFAHHGKRVGKSNEEAFLFAWLGSPEFIDELGDWQGGCMALTGFTKNDYPEITGVLRTGKSRMVPLGLRLALAASGEVRCIGRVEGVPILQIGDAEKRKRPEIARRMENPAAPLVRLFRSRRASIDYRIALLDDMPVEEPEEKPEFGCFLALMPGVIAAGSTPEILGDTIRRLKGKSASPSLATVPAFAGAAEMRHRPGLFTWFDPPRLTRLMNDFLRRDLIRRQDEIRHRPLAKGEKPNAAKRAAAIREAEASHRRDTQEWTMFQTLVNPAALRYAAVGCSLHQGEFAWRIEGRMKDKQTSPLLELLPSAKVGPDLLRVVPGDAFCLFAVPLPDGPAVLARLLKLADVYAAAGDDRTPPPSRMLHELEKSLKLHLSRDVLAKIQSAGVAVHLIGEPEKEGGLYPVFLFEAVSDDAAKDLETMLPRLYGVGGKPADPKQHILEGQVVRSFTDEAADPDKKGPPAHYGRRGKLLVLGWHRGRVAATLRDSIHKKDLLNLPRGLATVDAEGPVSALGLFSCRQWLSHIARIDSQAKNQDAAHLRMLRYLREMSAPMATMPPTLFAVKRLSDGMRVEFRQSELPAASATVVDIALTWLFDTEALGGLLFNQRWVGGMQLPPAPPPVGVVPAAMPAPAAAPVVPPPASPLP